MQLRRYLLGIVPFVVLIWLSCGDSGSDSGETDPVPSQTDSVLLGYCDSVPACGATAVTVAYSHWSISVGSFGLMGPGEYPRGSAEIALYSAGIWVGATKDGSPSVSEAFYSSEFRPGIILNRSAAAISALQYCMSTTSCVYLGNSGGSFEWPRIYGAPVQADGSPSILSTADTWSAYHDLDETLHNIGSPNPRLGVQIRQSTYHFFANPYSNFVYIKVRLENKSNQTYSDVHVGLFADVDLSDASANLIGSDIARNMAYCYSANYTTLIAVKAFPVGGTTPRAAVGFKNGADPTTDIQKFNLLQGLNFNGSARNGSTAPTYDFTGNPITGTGSLDGSPADKRILVSNGPVSLASGQSREFVFAIIGASGASFSQAFDQLMTNALLSLPSGL